MNVVIDGVEYAPRLDNEKMEAALLRLLSWVPESMGRKYDTPFMTEVHLYPLLGKEDARTLLAIVRRVCEAAGFDMCALELKAACSRVE